MESSGKAGAWQNRHPAALLAGLGVALEIVLIAGFTWPFSLRANPKIVTSPQSIAVVLGAGPLGALRLTIACLGAFSTFAAAMLAARQVASRAAVGVVLAGTVIFSVTLLPMNPLGAQDVFHDVADARTFWVYHQDPSRVAPSSHPHDWVTPSVPSWRATPSAYGPVWYALSGSGLLLAGKNLWANVIAQKVLTAAFLLGLTGLSMLLARRLATTTRAVVVAGVLVGWNPLLQFETAGNAHNDVVMVFFALAAIYALLRRWWPAVFPLFALAIATKPPLALLGPLLLLQMWTWGRARPRSVLISLGLGGAVLAAVYAPFFRGLGTFTSVEREAGHVTSSPGAVVYALLVSATGMKGAAALRLMHATVLPVFGLAYSVLLFRIRHAHAAQTYLRAAFWGVFVTLALLTWWFMPWYLFWLVPLAAPLSRAKPAWIAVVFSGAAMLSYVPHFWLLYDNLLLVSAVTALTAFLPPLLAIVVWQRRRPKRDAMPGLPPVLGRRQPALEV